MIDIHYNFFDNFLIQSIALISTIENFTWGKNCLDNICINLECNVYKSENIINNISDHKDAQLIKLFTRKAKIKNVYYYRNILNNTNLENFKTNILRNPRILYRYDFDTNRNLRFFQKHYRIISTYVSSCTKSNVESERHG